MILERIRQFPKLTLAQHRRLIYFASLRRWWPSLDPKPGPQVVYSETPFRETLRRWRSELAMEGASEESARDDDWYQNDVPLTKEVS
jgi:hypothetical protein